MKTLEDILNSSHSISDITGIPQNVFCDLVAIGETCEKQKAVYTVLATLLYYKSVHPEQDVRKHQARFPGGFSGRTFDTKNVTPVLKKMRLPAMAESGWLTRSLEQPYPYDLNYNGNIPSVVKMPFLRSLDYVEKHPRCAEKMLRILLNRVIKISEQHKVVITPLKNPDKLSISSITDALQKHFLHHYDTHNGAKLPVLAFHAIYSCLIKELKRYEGCTLASLSSLTACDRTNNASGDIEIFKDGKLFEAVEIKLDKEIDSQIVRVVEEKVYKWNPQRYYILSVLGTKVEDQAEISDIIYNVCVNHGCQIINNGLLPTIKYYLRLITDLGRFVNIYSKAVEEDDELQYVHKEYWNSLIAEYEL